MTPAEAYQRAMEALQNARLEYQDKVSSIENLERTIQQQQQTIQQQQEKINQHSTQIETLKTALQEEKTKVNRLKEVDEKKRRLTEDLGNGITLELVEIPAGKFLMGGREITLQPFLMGKYPVTQGQWEAVMGNNPSNFKGNNNLPVEMVNWDEANLFCQKLSALTGRKYQLPSDSQWEYACSAITSTNFFFGNEEKELEKYAWFGNNSNGQTHPVGEKLPNPWGLYDVLGNVWEWCQDDWLEGYNHIPVNGSSAWVKNSTTKCLRGGAWDSYAVSCRSDSRNRNVATTRSNLYCLRVVVLPDTL